MMIALAQATNYKPKDNFNFLKNWVSPDQPPSQILDTPDFSQTSF